MEDAYREDLAYIHDASFGHFARGAAALLLERVVPPSFRGGPEDLHDERPVSRGATRSTRGKM